MNQRIKIAEAISAANCNGKKIKIRELAQKLFPESTVDSAYIRFNGLVTGRIEKISKRSVNILCKELDVSPDDLFN